MFQISWWLKIVKMVSVLVKVKTYSKLVSSTCLDIIGFRGKFTLSSGAVGSFMVAENFVIYFLKMQFEQHCGRQAFRIPGHRQKQKIWIDNMATKMTIARLLHNPDSIGDMALKCSLITSKMCGLLGLVLHILTGGICFVHGSNCQSRAWRKKVLGWLSVCFQTSSSTSLIWSVLGFSIKWIAWLHVTVSSLILILIASLQVKETLSA